MYYLPFLEDTNMGDLEKREEIEKLKLEIIEDLNDVFPLPKHPFNMENEGELSYAKWQFTRGAKALEYFNDYANTLDMFQDKIVLDIGCGPAGKSLYYATQSAEKVIGVDILEKYKKLAEDLAKDLKLSEKFEFIAADSAKLPLDDESVDTVIINDAMEHVEKPVKTIREALRVLKPGGRLYINFPPYFHPYGAHLSDAISTPWIHMLFDEETLIKAYKEQVAGLPDGEERIKFRISEENGKECFSYINKMTIHRFTNILNRLNISPIYYKEVPLKKFLGPLKKVPYVREMAVKMVVCVIEK